MEITVGMKGTVSTTVEREDTALEVGSGSLLVYATPCMVALMEGAACEAISEALPEEKTSVGIELNISHVSATPVGLDVRAEAEVTAVEGSIITFQVTAYDEAGKIGEGTHKRAVISVQKFLDRTYAKL
jgi:predicted thioesterase